MIAGKLLYNVERVHYPPGPINQRFSSTQLERLAHDGFVLSLDVYYVKSSGASEAIPGDGRCGSSTTGEARTGQVPGRGPCAFVKRPGMR